MSVTINAENVRAIYSDFVTGNIEGVLNRHAPDVAWEFPGAPEVPFAGSSGGRECVARHFAAIFETVEPLSFDVERMMAQDDAVPTFVRVKARVRATGKTYETEMANLFTLRDGVVTKFQTYYDTRPVAEAFRQSKLNHTGV